MSKALTYPSPVYVVDGSRTPFLKATGKLGPFSASDLAVAAARPLFARLAIEPGHIDELILGCVMPGPDEANIARVTALRLGCEETVPAFTVQRNCASGLQALDSAARNIASGQADLILAGGTESMSHAPVIFNQKMVNWLGAWSRSKGFLARGRTLLQLRPAYFAPIIGLLRGLRDPIVGLSMGQTAENIAHRFNISRTMMDEFAMRSHHRLANAQQAGYFKHEIETIYSQDGNFYEQDNGVRPDSNMESLAKLKPVFDKHFGKVTAGNSAQITDGAAMLLLASERAVEQYQLPVLGRILDAQWAGLDPAQMGLGPIHAMTPVLDRNHLSLSDIDCWEINEAFAGQVLACLHAWNDAEYCQTHLNLKQAMGLINQDVLNVDGGGVSLGHPVGASGARIVLHLLNVLKRCNKTKGMASLCIGGGQGGAMLVESLDSINNRSSNSAETNTESENVTN